MSKFANYKQKMNKISLVLNTIYRFRVPIIATIVVAATAAFTLTGLNGTAQDVVLSDDVFEYGEDIGALGKSTFGSANLEYSIRNMNQWTTEVPYRAGEYDVRSFSYNGYGQRTTSKPKSFSIARTNLDIEIISKTLIYGEKIIFQTPNIIEGDSIDCFEYTFGEEYNQVNPFGNKDTFKTTFTIDLSTFKIINANNEDVTNCYNVPSEPFDINIKKRDLNILLHRSEKEYDGQPLTTEGNAYISDSTPLAEGDEIDIEYLTSVTEVGSVSIKDGIKITNGDIDRTNFYNVFYGVNELTITKRKLTISTNSIDRFYNGKQLSFKTDVFENQLTYSLSNELAPGHEFILKSFASEGAYRPLSYSTNTIEYAIVDSEGSDITNKCYEITENFGNINISPITLNISYKVVSPEYFAFQTLEGGYVLEGEVAQTDELINTLKDPYTTDSLSSIGSIEYEYDFSVYNNELETDVSDCYNIFVEDGVGTLQINAQPLELWSNSITRAYDGIPYSALEDADQDHKLVGFTNGLLEGHSVKFCFNANGQIFCNEPNSFSYEVVDENGNDVSSYYSISCNYGEIVTTKRELQMRFASTIWEFDAESHYDDSIVDTSGNGDCNLAKGDEIILNPDTYNYLVYSSKTTNIFDFEIVRKGVVVTHYYNIPSAEELAGTIEVTRRIVYISYEVPESRIYDGSITYINNEDITIENIPDNFTYNFVLNINRISVYKKGGYDIKIDDFRIYDKDLNDVTEYFNFMYKGSLYAYEHVFLDQADSLKLGHVDIFQRTLNIKTFDATKVYDGTPLDSYDAEENGSIYTITECDGLVNVDTIQITSTSSINYAGSKNNNIEIQINNPLLGNVTNCYIISKVLGILKVEESSLLIKFPAVSHFEYSGYDNYFDYSGFEVEGLVGNDYLRIECFPIARAGTYEIKDVIRCYVFNSEGEDVTSSYGVFTFIGSKMVIDKASMTIQMANINIDAIESNLPEDPADLVLTSDPRGPDTISLSYVGKPMDYLAEMQYPKIQYDVLDYNGESVKNSYKITYQEGNVEFGKMDVELQLKQTYHKLDLIYTDKIVDLEPYVETLFDNTKLPKGYEYRNLSLSVDREMRLPGKYTISIDKLEEVKIYRNIDGVEEDATHFFNISLGEHSTTVLTITKQEIKFSAVPLETVYSFQDKLNLNDLIYAGSLLSGDHAELREQTLISTPGKYHYDMTSDDIVIKDSKGNDRTYIYDIFVDDSIYDNGIDMTVHKVQLTINSVDIVKQFNGKAFESNDVNNVIFTYSYDNDSSLDYISFIKDSTDPTVFKGETKIKGQNILKLSFKIPTTDIFVCSTPYTYDCKILSSDGVTDVSDCYEVNCKQSMFRIDPLIITYNASHTSKTYDGNDHQTYQDLLSSDNTVVTVSLSKVLHKEMINYLKEHAGSAYVYLEQRDFLVGDYTYTPLFVIIYEDIDLVATGNIIFQSANGDVEHSINARSITIKNLNQDITLSRRVTKASEQLFIVSGSLANGDVLYIGDEQYESGKNNYLSIPDIVNGSEEGLVYGADYFGQYVNESSIKIYREVDGGKIDVTHCYKINYIWEDVVVRI